MGHNESLLAFVEIINSSERRIPDVKMAKILQQIFHHIKDVLIHIAQASTWDKSNHLSSYLVLLQNLKVAHCAPYASYVTPD